MSSRILAAVSTALLPALLALSAPRADPVPGGGAAAGATYEIDAAHSTVLFSINHLGIGRVFGRFNGLGGSFVRDPGDPAASKVDVEIAAATVDTGNRGRDRHLKSPDFFNAKQFPKITFRSTSVKAAGPGKLEIAGDLRLLGRTKGVILHAQFIGEGKDPWGGYRAGFTARATVRRSDFRMNYMLDKKPGLGDEVDLVIAVEGVRK